MRPVATDGWAVPVDRSWDLMESLTVQDIVTQKGTEPRPTTDTISIVGEQLSEHLYITDWTASA